MSCQKHLDQRWTLHNQSCCCFEQAVKQWLTGILLWLHAFVLILHHLLLFIISLLLESAWFLLWVLWVGSTSHNKSELYSAKCFWQVSDHICAACRGIIKHGLTEPAVSVDFLTHMDSSPVVNVKCWVGARWVSRWSGAVLLCASASGAQQVKHNKFQLSQT